MAEMKRIIRPGGRVYAEIPFIGAYHMAPVDYQRYTISGLEALFARHGFELEEIGICSGPFTAAALLFLHLATAIAPKGTKMIVRALFSWLVHPLKYLDLLCENAEWATYHACNFYYLGRKPDGTAR